MSTTQDRIDVMQAIDRFCEMASNHPDTPRHEYEGSPEMSYRVVYFPDTPGKNVTRIVMADENLSTGERRSRSVHCFIDNITGDVFKSAGWKAPAKGARYNLLTNFGEVERNFYWTGSYLYADWKRVD